MCVSGKSLPSSWSLNWWHRRQLGPHVHKLRALTNRTCDPYSRWLVVPCPGQVDVTAQPHTKAQRHAAPCATPPDMSPHCRLVLWAGRSAVSRSSRGPRRRARRSPAAPRRRTCAPSGAFGRSGRLRQGPAQRGRVLSTIRRSQQARRQEERVCAGALAPAARRAALRGGRSQKTLTQQKRCERSCCSSAWTTRMEVMTSWPRGPSSQSASTSRPAAQQRALQRKKSQSLAPRMIQQKSSMTRRRGRWRCWTFQTGWTRRPAR
jgi:hypothetical protein